MWPLYTYTYTENPTNLTPGHREIRAHSGKASPPSLPTSYQRWNGSQEPSHVLSDTEQVVGASEKCFLLSSTSAKYMLYGGNVTRNFVKIVLHQQ